MGENHCEEKMDGKAFGNVIFFIPLYYSIQTRFLRRSNWGVIVWITEFLIPVMLAMLILDIGHFNILHAIILIGTIYNFYEIGYIQNDCETIKKENKPTQRLSQYQLNYYESYKYWIYFVRLLIGLFLSWYSFLHIASWFMLLAMWLIIPYFMLYNYLRGRINLYLILPLTAYRYCCPLLLYGYSYGYPMWIIMMVLFVSYPIPTFIEICADGKGNSPERWTKIFLRNFEGRFVFRIWYYLVITIVGLYIAYMEIIPYWANLIPFYYLMDRIPQLKMKKLGSK